MCLWKLLSLADEAGLFLGLGRKNNPLLFTNKKITAVPFQSIHR
jgi:hypothetical protein